MQNNSVTNQQEIGGSNNFQAFFLTQIQWLVPPKFPIIHPWVKIMATTSVSFSLL